MLYTVRPMERIYASPEIFDASRKSKPGEQEPEAEYREVLLPNGRIITRRQGEGFIIEKINSTDMKDYLNEEYSPGKDYKEKQNKK